MKKTNATLLIIGIGDLAGLTLDMISRTNDFDRIILAGRNPQKINERKNLSLLVSSQLGFFPQIECVQMDLNNIDQTATTITNLKPEIIFNTATLQSWRMITYLPKQVFHRLDQAQFGPWLPMHLVLTHKLMQAVRESGITTKVINAAFPDAVAPILKTIEMAPIIGIGNVANVIPAFRQAVATHIKSSPQKVTISLFAQHYFSHRIPIYGNAGGAPYLFRAVHSGQDISQLIDQEKILASVSSDFKRTGGAFRQMITAASATAVIRAMIRDSKEVLHAPGPNGLPGGYQVRISFDNVQVELPEGVSLENVVAINEACQRFDGIERIDSQGTVYFTSREMCIMKEMLGYECKQMTIEDSEGWANELGNKYSELVNQYSQ